MAWEIKWQATGATHTDINTLDDATRKEHTNTCATGACVGKA